MKTRAIKFYFIGIGGAGMSGLAEILMDMGHQVSGSDREKTEVTRYLESKGAKIYEGHRAENVNAVDFLVFSSAIPADNPEMERARMLHIPLIRRAEMLGQLFNRKFGIGIAGTHGKTSTTSMLSSILLQAEMDPTIVAGGRLQNLMTNARLGGSDWLVAEADEYDRSFLALFPRIAVITSLEEDHLDIYADLNDLKKTFLQFANQTAFDGTVILCADDENLNQIRPEINSLTMTFGLSEKADLSAKTITYDKAASSWDLYLHGELLGHIKLHAPGAHNVKNALAAAAAALELGVSFADIQRGLAEFKGVGRRFEIVDTVNDILIVDDYAHHPSETEAALNAALNGWQRRVIAVFQPHLYSRTRDFYAEFAAVLSKADTTVITNVYPARELPLPGVSGKMIADALENEHHYVENKGQLAQELSDIVRPGDLVLFMGAGDIWKSSRELATLLKKG